MARVPCRRPASSPPASLLPGGAADPAIAARLAANFVTTPERFASERETVDALTAARRDTEDANTAAQRGAGKKAATTRQANKTAAAPPGMEPRPPRREQRAPALPSAVC